MINSAPEPVEIGRRARTIRRRRGLSLDVAAGLAGISKSYLSRLETGDRQFERRGCWTISPQRSGAPSRTSLDSRTCLPTGRPPTRWQLCRAFSLRSTTAP